VCLVPQNKLARRRIDLTAAGDKVEFHGWALVETKYYPGGSLTCVVGVEKDMAITQGGTSVS